VASVVELSEFLETIDVLFPNAVQEDRHRLAVYLTWQTICAMDRITEAIGEMQEATRVNENLNTAGWK